MEVQSFRCVGPQPGLQPTVMNVCADTHRSTQPCQILEAQTSNAVWLHSPGILSALLEELCCLCVEQAGNPCICWLLSCLLPLQPPVCVCCIKAWLLLGRHSPCDSDETASADTASIAYRNKMSQFSEASLGKITIRQGIVHSEAFFFMENNCSVIFVRDVEVLLFAVSNTGGGPPLTAQSFTI